MMYRQVALLMGLLFMALFVGSCSDDEIGGTSCSTDLDCSVGEFCNAGLCETSVFCSNDTDCPVGYSCIGERCEPAQSCTTWEECPDGYDCLNGQCIEIDGTPSVSCQSHADCPTGQICDLENGICVTVDVPGSGDGDTSNEKQSCEDSRDCPNGYHCVEGYCEAWDNPDGDDPDGDNSDGDDPDGDDPDGDIPLGNLCNECESDPDCNENLKDYCMEDLSGRKFCMRFCGEGEPDCPQNYRCSDIFSGTGDVVSSQCQPVSGYCSDEQTDGDDSDGDSDEVVEPGLGLCESCSYDGECGGVFDMCIADASGGTFCGTDCAHGQACAAVNTYCKHISDTVSQCWPTTNSCEDGPIDGDDPTDGDIPVRCSAHSDCQPGEICETFTGLCVYVLCSPCTSAFDCGSLLDTTCLQGGCATNCGLFSGMSCPSGFQCIETGVLSSYCVPVSGTCGGSGAECEGFCDTDTYPLTCVGEDNLCSCDSGELMLENCGTICREADYADASRCGDNPDTGEDICYCLPFCDGYTGSNSCCAEGDPCGWGDDQICDCGGACDWEVDACNPVDGDTDGDDTDGDDTDGDSESCSGSCTEDYPFTCYGDSLCVCDNGQLALHPCQQVCADGGYEGYDSCDANTESGMDICYCTGAPGTCDGPFMIGSLPYSVTDSTNGAASSLDADGCEDVNGFGNIYGGSGPEHVYALEVTAGGSYEVRVDTDFDAVLSVRSPCANDVDVCLGADDEITMFPEVIYFDVSNSGYVYIVVDGYSSGSSGSYTLTVEED